MIIIHLHIRGKSTGVESLQCHEASQLYISFAVINLSYCFATPDANMTLHSLTPSLPLSLLLILLLTVSLLSLLLLLLVIIMFIMALLLILLGAALICASFAPTSTRVCDLCRASIDLYGSLISCVCVYKVTGIIPDCTISCPNWLLNQSVPVPAAVPSLHMFLCQFDGSFIKSTNPTNTNATRQLYQHRAATASWTGL